MGRNAENARALLEELRRTLGQGRHLGRYVEHFRHKRWFPVNERQLARAQASYHRYGRWTLLLSWVPIIGDPLTLVAGVMREPLWSFLLIVSLAKTGRYLMVMALTLGWM